MLPGEFIPLAERSGLIVELGRWVLAEACAEQARWSDAGMQLPVSVNLSRCSWSAATCSLMCKGCSVMA
jgi:EAL domain-containing protein (putative c-di-GMP-specific phosphodiesterase class I)